MTETEAARLLDDLRARYCAEPYDPARDVTLDDVMTALSLTEHPARSLLEREVREGRMTCRMVYVNARQRSVWRST
jgi:hypothetical protein